MKESIFFNKEQLKIIHWYGIVYKGVFRYWVTTISLILSFVALGYFVCSSCFSPKFIAEEALPSSTESQDFYVDKQQTVFAISGLTAKILNGKIESNTEGFNSENNLLEMEGLVLPELTSLSFENLDTFVEHQNDEVFNDAYLKKFFSSVIEAPLKQQFSFKETAKLLLLSWSIHESFGLNCVEGATKYSFVCKSYIKNFLDQFFLYNLDDMHLKTEENSEEGSEDPNTKGGMKISEELTNLYKLLRKNKNYRWKFCQGLVRYGQYGGILDDRFSEIFHDCGSEYYNQFITLRDFSALSRTLELGYADAKIYSSQILNEYKLISLQQAIYKQLSNTSDVKSLMQSYFNFLREILIKEKSKNADLIGAFPKTFTYRYNMNIIAPYLKDENSKMTKEDRTALTSQLLSLNYGDKIANFAGLQDQVRYEISSSTGTPHQQSINSEKEEQDLERLFRSSYLPAQFTLISVKKGKESSTLLVQGVDRRTNLTVEAKLKYENILLSVTEIKVAKNPKLTEYLNALIKNDRLSLNKVLNLMQENKQIAEQTQPLDLRLCSQLQGKYGRELLSCSNTQAKISLATGTRLSDGTVTASPLGYTLGLKNGTLHKLEISDKVLETKILEEIDFSLVDASSTFYIINALIGYVPKEKNSGFWMKEHLLVADKFSKYLDIIPEKVISEWWTVKVYFAVGELHFIGTYDLVKNVLRPIAIDFGTKRRPVVVQDFELVFRDDKAETLNSFLLDPLAFLRELNAALVEKYFDKPASANK